MKKKKALPQSSLTFCSYFQFNKVILHFIPLFIEFWMCNYVLTNMY